MKIFSSDNRNFGLDIARCTAILLVLIAHAGIPFIFGLNTGFLGVEIFFVLSGFLIGQIILREFKTEVTLESCGTFYINRWLRTFPLYYLVLIIKDVLVHSFHPKHYLFVQQGADLVFFPVSWSLAIEEWFYILIPLVFIVNTKLFRLQGIAFIVLLMLLVAAARFVFIYTNTPEFDLEVRKSIPLRFDALLAGVLFSLFKVNYPDAYRKIGNYRSATLSVVLFGIAFLIYKKYVLLEASVPAGFSKSFFQTIVFIFFSFSFGFFIIWLEQSPVNKLGKKNILVRGITALSILTYAIYLVHYDIFKWLIQSPVYSGSWMLELLMCMGIILVITTMLHVLIEKPVMDYRKTLVKKLFGEQNTLINR